MAILVRTCCCGCDLRTGVLLIGIFGLLSTSYTIYSNWHLITILTAEVKDTSRTSTLEVVTSLSIAGVGFGGVSMLTNLLLLWSSHSKNLYLAYPYLFWNIFMLLYTLGVTTFFIVIWTDGFPYIILGTILAWPLSVYFIIVVHSYIETLRQDPSALWGPVPMQMQPTPYARLQEV